MGTAIALMALTGCRGATKIHEITSHAEKFDGQKVVLEGTVSVVPYVTDNDPSKGGCFVVYDCTGYVRVITKKYMPLKGECVNVYGRVQVTKNSDGSAPDIVLLGDSAPKTNRKESDFRPLPKEYGN